MHDLRWLRENPAKFDRGLTRRGLPPRADEVLALDREWRAGKTPAEKPQATRNRLSRDIGTAKKRGESVDELMQQIEGRREAEAATAAQATELRKQIDGILEDLPNLPAGAVPPGAGHAANLAIRPSGTPPQL